MLMQVSQISKQLHTQAELIHMEDVKQTNKQHTHKYTNTRTHSVTLRAIGLLTLLTERWLPPMLALTAVTVTCHLVTPLVIRTLTATL